MSNINYVGVLEYLKKYYGLSYKNPDTKGLTDEEKNNFLLIKKVSQETINEVKKIAEQCKKLYSLCSFSTIKWLDGTNTKIKKFKDLDIDILMEMKHDFY